MTEKLPEQAYGDPLHRPFWRAAKERRLIIQQCASCGAYQFYARPFCLSCYSDQVGWVDARGAATIYSLTTVRVGVIPELTPPYQVAVVELEEGPRLLGGIVGNDGQIGDPVEIRWRERKGLPPLPMFAVIRRDT